MLDLDPCGGTDPLGMFPLFLKRTADVMAPRLSVVFRRLVRLGSFPACWRQANATPIPKGSPSSSVANYRPISITSVLSKAGVLNKGGISLLRGNGRPVKSYIKYVKYLHFFSFKYFAAFHIQPFNAYCIIYGTYRNLSYKN